MTDPSPQMAFESELAKTSCLPVLAGEEKEAIIVELVDLVVRDGKIPKNDRDLTVRALLEREEKMSTGMQDGVAIPHGKTARAEGLTTALALKTSGVDFDSLDGEPSRIFVMTVAPDGEGGTHIKFLAEVSKLLGRAEVREELLAADTPEAMRAVLLSASHEP